MPNSVLISIVADESKEMESENIVAQISSACNEKQEIKSIMNVAILILRVK
jgi:hypothetical protein